MTGFKQRFFMRLLKEKGKVSIQEVRDAYYGSKKAAEGAMTSLMALGFARRVDDGWEPTEALLKAELK